ncbi:hypothetical protein JW905_16335 [bacterium]|nr:hypothetical protein [candidate division CSSED10-310 bacterium]
MARGLHDLATIRSMGDAFNQRLEEEYWLNWVGLLDRVDLNKLFGAFSGLFERDTVAYVREQMGAAADPEARRRLRALVGSLILFYLEEGARDLQAEVLRAGAEAVVEVGGERLAYRSLAVRIMQQPDRERRLLLNGLQREVQRLQLNPLRRDMLRRQLDLVHDLGYSSYVEAMEEAQNRRFAPFAHTARRFLEDSADLYRKYLEYYLDKHVGVAVTDAHMTDLARLQRSSEFDSYFTSERLIPVVKQTWSGLGYDLDANPFIKLDLEERPRKLPRACVSAVNPPTDIRLTIYPTGGFQDYDNFMHESGHAQHFSHMRMDLEYEYKFWGDRGFTEGMAYLFQHLCGNHLWLEEMVGMRDQAAFRRFVAFSQLRNLRRLLAQFLYEFELFSTERIDEMPQVYTTILGEGAMVAYDPEGYLGFDMEFYNAGYARARLFEVQLRTYLEEQYGSGWWRDKRAGAFLADLWREGRRVCAEEVLEGLGLGGLQPAAYLVHAAAVLD